MTDFRIQRFANPDDMQFADRGVQPPATGWTIVDPGDVYRDGVRVGRNAVWRLDPRDHGTPYAYLEYRALEDPSG